jgi:hypothetical protein
MNGHITGSVAANGALLTLSPGWMQEVKLIIAPGR